MLQISLLRLLNQFSLLWFVVLPIMLTKRHFLLLHGFFFTKDTLTSNPQKASAYSLSIYNQGAQLSLRKDASSKASFE